MEARAQKLAHYKQTKQVRKYILEKQKYALTSFAFKTFKISYNPYTVIRL